MTGRKRTGLTARDDTDPRVKRMIDRLCSGDSDAWSEFIERYRRLIYSAIHRANGRYGAEWDETALDELFEEAVYKLLRQNGRALRSWKGKCKLETWIYRIVRNVCIDRLRKEGRRGEVPELELGNVVVCNLTAVAVNRIDFYIQTVIPVRTASLRQPCTY